jgi:hypothetical protein
MKNKMEIEDRHQYGNINDGDVLLTVDDTGKCFQLVKTLVYSRRKYVEHFHMLWGNTQDQTKMGCVHLEYPDGRKAGLSKAIKIFMTAIKESRNLTFTK